MSETSGAYPAEDRRQITHETVSLAEGPIDLYIADTSLQIVDPIRDLDRSSRQNVNTDVGCFVVDPLPGQVGRNTGYKAIRDGETITLGRRHTYGRFNFSGYVSGTHVEIFRDGDNLIITDLGSTNGTFLGGQETPVISGNEDDFDTIPLPADPSETSPYKAAGESVAADHHPDVNEDTFFIDTGNRAVGVFDGMGGVPGSEEASALAASSAERSLRNAPLTASRDAAQQIIRQALEHARDDVVIRGKPNIGTTAIITKVFETESGSPYAVVGNVGDSRAYLIRDGQIEDMTLDHAFGKNLNPHEHRELQEALSQVTDLSQLTPRQRNIFEHRNRINSCLGNGDINPTISVLDFQLLPGDQLLLTSDGIHDNLTSDEIEQTIGTDTDATVQNLVTAAQARSRERGHPRAKRDDMTAVILAYEG